MSLRKFSIVMGIVLVIGVVGSLLTFRTMGGSNSVEERVAINAIDAADVTAIEIHSDISSILVSPTDGDEIIVTLEGRVARNFEYSLVTDIENSTLKIELNQKQIRYFNLGFSNQSLTMTVSLPEKQYESFLVDSDLGEIIVNDIQANKVQVFASVGSIRLNNVISEQTITSNDVGETVFTNLEGDLDATASVGEIRFIAETITQNLVMKNDIGAIKIELANEPENATIVASTSLGSATIFGESTTYKVFGDGENMVKLSAEIGEVTVRVR